MVNTYPSIISLGYVHFVYFILYYSCNANPFDVSAYALNDY